MQSISIERVWQDGQGDSLGSELEIEIWPYKQAVYAQLRIYLWDFEV